MFLSYIHRLDEAPVIQELKSKRLIQISNIRVENLTPRAFTFPFFFFLTLTRIHKKLVHFTGRVEEGICSLDSISQSIKPTARVFPYTQRNVSDRDTSLTAATVLSLIVVDSSTKNEQKVRIPLPLVLYLLLFLDENLCAKILEREPISSSRNDFSDFHAWLRLSGEEEAGGD